MVIFFNNSKRCLLSNLFPRVQIHYHLNTTILFCQVTLTHAWKILPGTFGEVYKFLNLIKEPTYFKSPENPTCIDLVLTKKVLRFKSTYVIETRLSDFHKMIVAVMKMHFPKKKQQVVSYRKYKNFHNKTFLYLNLSLIINFLRNS